MLVRERGSGEAVVLLHGTPSPATDWLPVAERLASRYRVLVPDLPGYGESPAPRQPTIEAIGDELAAMLAERGISRLRAIAGYSTGAYRAFDLVVRHRIEVDVIVSIAGMVTFDDEARAMRQQFADTIEGDPGFLESVAMREVMLDLMMSPGWRATHPADEDRVADWVRLSSPHALVRELRALAAARDLREELATLETVVYARVGELDRGAPPAWSQQIVATARHAELDVVAGCGHALLIEDLAGTIDAIEQRIEGA